MPRPGVGGGGSDYSQEQREGWEMREHRPRKDPGALGKLCLRGTGQLGTSGQSDGRALPEHGCCGPGGCCGPRL